MALDPVLARIPGLGGFLAMDQYSRGQETQELGNAVVGARLQDHFREEGFRKGITPGMGNDEILNRAIRSVGPDKAATLLQGQANLRETQDTRKQIALNNLSAKMLTDKQRLEIAARNATSHEQRAQVAAARAKMDAFYRGQAAQIASGKLYDETGIAGVGGGQFDISTLLAPPSGPVGPPGSGLPSGQEAIRQLPPLSQGGGTVEYSPSDHMARVFDAPAGSPAGVPPARLGAELAPQATAEAGAPPTFPGYSGYVPPQNPDTELRRAPPAPNAAATAPKGLPPDVQALIDREPSPKKKREIEQRYVMSRANKEIGINLAGGRESVFINRVVNSGNQAAADLENVVQMPLTVSRGIFGGRQQGGSLFEAGKETLANAMTTEDVQLYNTFATGFQRALAAIEGAGLAPTNALMHQMDQVIFKEGDTNFVKLAKLAQIRQIVEKGMDTVTANSRVDPGTKKLVEEIVGKVRKSVPFTGQDLLKLRQQQQKNPNVSIADIVGLKKDAASDPKMMSDEELLKKLRGG